MQRNCGDTKSGGVISSRLNFLAQDVECPYVHSGSINEGRRFKEVGDISVVDNIICAENPSPP